jgi:hypothetical protein
MRDDEKEKASVKNSKLQIRELEGMSRSMWGRCP